MLTVCACAKYPRFLLQAIAARCFIPLFPLLKAGCVEDGAATFHGPKITVALASAVLVGE